MRKTDVVQYFRTQRAVAKALGITEQAVSAWPEIVPRGRQFELQVLTGGRLQASTATPERRVS